MPAEIVTIRGVPIARYPRADFLGLTPGQPKRWLYRRGDHVSFIGVTGSGKTTFMRQLLAVTATPQLPALVLAVKPRDKSMDELGRDAKLKVTRTWPALRIGMETDRRNGHILWPKHTFDPDVDEERHRAIFRRAILQSYKNGGKILVIDEALSMTSELSLSKECVTVWSKGRAMGCGLWAGTQKPTHVPLWMYGQAQHLFLSHDPDRRSRKRLVEIGGGIDPALLEECMGHLGPYEWIYVRTKDRRVCIVGA